MDTIHVAKINLRKVIDCHANMSPTKSLLFDHYEALSKRFYALKSVVEDLKMKKTLFVAERKRCNERSKCFICRGCYTWRRREFYMEEESN